MLSLRNVGESRASSAVGRLDVPGLITSAVTLLALIHAPIEGLGTPVRVVDDCRTYILVVMHLSEWASRVAVSKFTASRRFPEGTLPVLARRVGRLILVGLEGAPPGRQARTVLYVRMSSPMAIGSGSAR